MTAASMTQLAYVRETTHGTTPTTPRMRKARFTGEGLVSAPTYVDSDEVRSDRMNADPTQNIVDNNGPINFEWTYPENDTFLSDVIRSALWNTWNNTPERDNDGTADSVITDVATTNTEVTHTTGAAFVAGHLVKFSGFGVAGNNGVFKATTGGATTSRYVGSGITNEAAPPAAAKMKVVGFQGASGDITATATGLGSTALDFTTLGLAVGQWVKIGGTAAGDQFATAALNSWARVAAIAATALTLDNRPSGWTTDAGTSKTIKVWYGDWIKNGTTRTSLSVERGYLGQTTPSYLLQKGMTANTLNLSVATRGKATGSVGFMGLGSADSTTAQDASPDAVTTGKIFSGNANVGRINEAAAQLTSPNWARSITFDVNNNQRLVEDVTSISAVEVVPGDFGMQVQVETYFGDLSLRTKFLAGTATSISSRLQRDSQAIIWEIPRCTYRDGGNPNIQAKSTDVMLPLTATASYDSTTAAHLLINRLPYYE